MYQWIHLTFSFIGGILGGAVSTTLFQPLDLIKTRFQGNQIETTLILEVQTNRTHKASNVQTLFPSYKGTLHACSTVIKTEGFLALYKGLLPNVIGSSLSWGIYVFVYVNRLEQVCYIQIFYGLLWLQV